ncbi:hypothetical protein CFI10_00500 [Marinobacterium iners]|uniref:GntR family transcriptional regulator n=1 Tax=Marinobacterium iners TaxID=48076 RepID=UPI001A8EBDEA|nr:GntR family transcriptional regulator [Marinobacterium iners]QSR33490.1 hypothetical protein CFI10_00500 [Marinobacterium iners]
MTDKKITVVERVALEIANGIISGRFAPGQRLVESDLAQQFNTSRNPLREAFSRLASEGLLTIKPYQGAFVRRPTRQDLIEIFEVRENLEILAARRAALNISTSPLRHTAIEVSTQLNNDNSKSLNFSEHIKENQSFHQLIMAISGNNLLKKTIDQLQLPIFQSVFFQSYNDNIWSASSLDHKEIINAILSGDPDASEAAISKHIQRTSELLLSLPDNYFST